jgi:hypothetical protein
MDGKSIPSSSMFHMDAQLLSFSLESGQVLKWYVLLNIAETGHGMGGFLFLLSCLTGTGIGYFTKLSYQSVTGSK